MVIAGGNQFSSALSQEENWQKAVQEVCLSLIHI